jgi:hypothetical protein
MVVISAMVARSKGYFLCHILSVAMESNLVERYLNRESDGNVFCTLDMPISYSHKKHEYMSTTKT